MRIHSLNLGFVLVCVLFVVSFSNADHQQFEIVGFAECADCQQNNVKLSHAFSGLHVSIECKRKKGIKRVGDGEVDEGGKFKISLPKGIQLFPKTKCYAQLHSAAAVPCPAHDGLETAKIEFKSQIHNKIIFSPAKTLRFSTALCTSKLLWPFFDYPPLPKTDPWKKDWPEITIPPLESFGHPWSFPPTYKPKPKLKPMFKPPIVKPLPPLVLTPKPPVFQPLPPAVPIYKPPTKPIPPPFYKPIPKPPVVKPLPPPVPIYKPPVVKPFPPPVPIYKPPVVKQLPPRVPIYKPPVVKPLPPPVPIYKPPVVKTLPPPVPIYKPPVVKSLPPPVPIYKPLPPPVPIYEPPVVTKPLPPPFPLFPLPPLYKKKPCPPFTKIPPKYYKFKHPKFGYFPKLPPFIPNP